MEITKELLEKYGKGMCSDEEQNAIQEWLRTLEIPSTEDRRSLDENIDRDRVWLQLSQEVPALLRDNDNLNRPDSIIPLYRRVAKYAAVACLVLVAFVGGRLSVNTSYAHTTKKQTADHLHFSGAYGAKGHLPGENFKVNIDGTIRLYNDAPMEKKIQVGDTIFALASMTEYYLIGTNDNVRLLNGHQLEDNPMVQYGLEGVFSIHRLDK